MDLFEKYQIIFESHNVMIFCNLNFVVFLLLEMSPVSVDRVGTYFRKALTVQTSQTSDSPPGKKFGWNIS